MIYIFYLHKESLSAAIQHTCYIKIVKILFYYKFDVFFPIYRACGGLNPPAGYLKPKLPDDMILNLRILDLSHQIQT